MWQHIFEFFKDYHPEHYLATAAVVFVCFAVMADKKAHRGDFFGIPGAILAGLALLICIFSIHWIVGVSVVSLILLTTTACMYFDWRDWRDEKIRREEERRRCRRWEEENRIWEEQRRQRRKLQDAVPPESIWKDDAGD